MSVVDVALESEFAVPRERVYEALLDHESMSKWTPARVKVIARGGSNGVGTVRRVRLGRLHFDEEIFYADAPTRIVYRIVRGLPVDFHRGEIILSEPRPGVTTLKWNIRLVSPVPMLARSIARTLKPALELSLRQLRGLIGG